MECYNFLIIKASVLIFAWDWGPGANIAIFSDILVITPASSLWAGSLQGPAAGSIFYKLHARATDFVLSNNWHNPIYNSDESGFFKGELDNFRTSPRVVTMPVNDWDCKPCVRAVFAESQPLSLQRFSEVLVRIQVLSCPMPCTFRREQLSPRPTSLTSNPRLLHSLHGVKQIIDHITS